MGLIHDTRLPVNRALGNLPDAIRRGRGRRALLQTARHRRRAGAAGAETAAATPDFVRCGVV